MKFLIVILVLWLPVHFINAQMVSESFQIKGIPADIYWINEPKNWSLTDTELSITAGDKTDFFIDPRKEYQKWNAPAAVFIPDDTFLLSVQVKVGLHSEYDAGVLIIYENNTTWAKLCLELSPAGKPFLVSVVNNKISDDTNHMEISNQYVFIRIAGLGKKAYALHYSEDGKHWNLLRYFSLESINTPKVGFSSQSPAGDECTSVFSNIVYQEKKLNNIRSGN